MADHNELGKKGEELAAEFLIHHGFKIRDRNWKYVSEELDIVAEKEGKLVVVEVKARSQALPENPYSLVPLKKQKFLIRATDAYIKAKRLSMEGRFDLLFVIFNADAYQITHIEDAFFASV